MEQQTKTTRELAIEWWHKLNIDEMDVISEKYPQHIGKNIDGILSIYLSENPQTETIKDVDLTDASRLNDNTLYKFFRDENAALKQRIKELEREVISLRKNNSTHY